MTYAVHTVELREMPAMQCTSVPPELFCSQINSMQSSKKSQQVFFVYIMGHELFVNESRREYSQAVYHSKGDVCNGQDCPYVVGVVLFNQIYSIKYPTNIQLVWKNQ
eukprot:TRINITY_DN5753_c0_g1_i2.p2 TRINITY_DN5753_c0_g1~~TRINITY_DN5753_c0_g1_i2.p2  ORF type:complete len:107 (+),score=0.67 TRINITY_DN5753_c0_g1_i2:198-518(+)